MAGSELDTLELGCSVVYSAWLRQAPISREIPTVDNSESSNYMKTHRFVVINISIAILIHF